MKDQIELPEPKYPGTKADIPNAIPDLYTADQVRAAIEADRKRRLTRASWPEPLSEFREGQWWVKELDAMKDRPGTLLDQKRAVAVVHHLLASIQSQRRGEPVAWVKQDIVENQFINMRPRRIWWECNEGIGMPIFAAPQPAEPVANTHIDDDAVDHFAGAMKEKLAQARAKGRAGWHECAPKDLSQMLHEHVEKGDPVDVANFCMFLWSLGQSIVSQPAKPTQLGYTLSDIHEAYSRGKAQALKAQSAEPVSEFVKAEYGNYPVLKWRPGYKAMIGDKFYLAPQPAEPDDERLAMEAVMETVDPSTWPGLTATQRCALGRFAKPQPAEPVSHDLYKTGDPGAPEQILDRNGEVVLDLCKRCGKAEIELAEPCIASQSAEPVKVPSDDLAHEIWAAAQTAPGEGIEDAVERVAALLAPSKEIVGYVSSDPKRLNQYMSKAQYESALPKNRVAFDIPVGPLLPTHHHGE